MAGEEHNNRLLLAEELVREFFLFRGFTSTLRSFEVDLASDLGHGFQVDRIVELVFSVYIPHFEADKLHALIAFLAKRFVSPQDAPRARTLRAFETALKRYYIVHALQKGKVDRVLEFFERYGAGLARTGEDWHAWFALPYIKGPHLDPHFQVYFSREWLDTLVISFGNFLNEVFNGIRFPVLLKVSSELIDARALKGEVQKLSSDCDRLRSMLAQKEEELLDLKRKVLLEASQPSSSCHKMERSSTITTSHGKHSSDLLGSYQEREKVRTMKLNASESLSDGSSTPRKSRHEQGSSCANCEDSEAAAFSLPGTMRFPNRTAEEQKARDTSGSLWLEDDIPEVAVESQECFSGHTSPISRCRFSASGANIASASIDGTVRIWNSDSASSTSRNATICCGAEVMSLEWDIRKDRLLLIGMAERGIKVWNVDAKRVVCDLSTNPGYPRILDLRCSPVEPIFASAAASNGSGKQGIEAMGFAFLTLWNMKTWKPLTFLPLGEDPPAITSVCFNHNGKMLAAGATDGMIHLFDTYACLPITGWPAHYSSVSCVKFGPDQSSIFSLGADGKVFEWSLHNQGQVLKEQDASSFCQMSSLELPRHEMALDAQGKMLLLTSNSLTSPLYHLEQRSTQQTLQHSAAITSVDWHPLQNKFLTGSADHSVRVTSML